MPCPLQLMLGAIACSNRVGIRELPTQCIFLPFFKELVEKAAKHFLKPLEKLIQACVGYIPTVSKILSMLS